MLSVQSEGNIRKQENKQYKTKSHEFDISVSLARPVHTFFVDSCTLPCFAMIYHHTLSEKTNWYLFHFPVYWLRSRLPFPSSPESRLHNSYTSPSLLCWSKARNTHTGILNSRHSFYWNLPPKIPFSLLCLCHAAQNCGVRMCNQMVTSEIRK